MTTISQLIRKTVKRLKKFHKCTTPLLKHCPQKKGVCVQVFRTTPRKPNSARRQVAKIFLYSVRRHVRAQVPGENYSLVKHNRVLIRGGRSNDLPGIRYRVVRGKFDAKVLPDRRNGRSKYGTKRPFLKKTN